MNQFKFKIVTLGLLAACMAGASVAHTEAAGVRSVEVKYSDLNMQSLDGARALHRRLVAAARQVCPDAYARDLAVAMAGRRCIDAAVDRAVEAVAQPKLAQVHALVTNRG